MSKAGKAIQDEMQSERKRHIPISGVSLSFPCFFPSISSVKTNLKVLEYLEVLKSVDHPLFLISAYDLHNLGNKRDLTQIKKILEDSVTNGKAVILDSGNYESFWWKDKTWERENFWSYLRSYDYGVAFHFDKRQQKMRPRSAKSIVDEIEKCVIKDQEQAYKGTIIPIVHAPSGLLVEISSGIAEKLNPIMIAIPERELGDGIFARSETVINIRKELNRRDTYYPIHLLGTGNPLSMLIYVICGADSFDGLEWCQTVVDYDTALLYHFQQREFFCLQTNFNSTSIPYTQATLVHNLLFYRKWMQEIQNSLKNGQIINLAQKHLPKPFYDALMAKLAKN
ncbi:MAG: hypothetical protein MUO89_09790 [Dehalococcoidia bacterium]|nr:hypothetical protein [Dehalococcoidia bacterium]